MPFLARTITALTAMVLPFFYSVSVMALPAPKSEADMLADADLVVDATSVAVLCEGPPESDVQKTTTTYRSTLEPSKSYKGGLPKSLEIIGKVEKWAGIPPIGGWFQGPVAKGWAGKLYLERETDGTYTKVWWNAMLEDSATSSPEALPDCTAKLDASVADALQPDGSVPDGPLPDGPAAVELDQGPGDSAPSADSSVPSDGGVVADSGTSSKSDGGCRFGGGGDEGAPSYILALMLLGLCAFRRR